MTERSFELQMQDCNISPLDYYLLKYIDAISYHLCLPFFAYFFLFHNKYVLKEHALNSKLTHANWFLKHKSVAIQMANSRNACQESESEHLS